MKCTDRELLEKLLWLKERADQRRGRLQARREAAPPYGRSALRAHAMPAVSIAREVSQAPEREAPAVAPASSEAGTEGSIVPWLLDRPMPALVVACP